MKRFLLLLFFLLTLCTPLAAHAQTSPLPEQPFTTKEEFAKAKILSVIKQSTQEIDGYKTLTQTVKVQFLEGSMLGKTVTIDRGNDVRLSASQKLFTGETVVVDITTQPNAKPLYTVADTYRLDYLLYLAIAFFAFILFVAGTKGFGAIIGLGISLIIIVAFIIPQMLHGADPLVICILGSLIILVITTFLAHGFSKQTAIAVVSTFLSLAATVIFSLIAVQLAHLAGLGTEDSYLLEMNPSQSINPKGLLLGGIIIGALGALNDITTTQVAAIFALLRTNPNVDFLHLIEEGFTIGREHIVSLVNTLVLAYAGASLTIFIFFVLNPSHLPTWVIINNESVAEEIVRTLAGSMGLVLAIPITTLIAAWWAIKNTKTLKK